MHRPYFNSSMLSLYIRINGNHDRSTCRSGYLLFLRFLHLSVQSVRWIDDGLVSSWLGCLRIACSAFRYIYFVEGILYCAVAFFFFYYGVKVSRLCQNSLAELFLLYIFLPWRKRKECIYDHFYCSSRESKETEKITRYRRCPPGEEYRLP